MHSFKTDYWREDLIVVKTFYLGEPFGNKPGVFAAIRLDIKDPLVLDDFFVFGAGHQLKYFTLPQGF